MSHLIIFLCLESWTVTPYLLFYLVSRFILSLSLFLVSSSSLIDFVRPAAPLPGFLFISMEAGSPSHQTISLLLILLRMAVITHRFAWNPCWNQARTPSNFGATVLLSLTEHNHHWTYSSYNQPTTPISWQPTSLYFESLWTTTPSIITSPQGSCSISLNSISKVSNNLHHFM